MLAKPAKPANQEEQEEQCLDYSVLPSMTGCGGRNPWITRPAKPAKPAKPANQSTGARGAMKLTLVKRPSKESSIKCDKCDRPSVQQFRLKDSPMQHYCDNHDIVEHWEWSLVSKPGKWALIIGPEGTPFYKD